jgi:hypothetical protein
MNFLDTEAAVDVMDGDDDDGLDDFEEDGFIVFDTPNRRKRKRKTIEKDQDEPLHFPVITDETRLIRAFTMDVSGRTLLAFVGEATMHRYIVVKGYTDDALLHCYLDVPLQDIFDYHRHFERLSQQSPYVSEFIKNYQEH